MFMLRIRHGSSFSRRYQAVTLYDWAIRCSCVSHSEPPETLGSVVPGHTDRVPRSNFSHIERRAPSSRRCIAAASGRTESHVRAALAPDLIDFPDSDIDRPDPLLVRPPHPLHAPFEDRFALDD